MWSTVTRCAFRTGGFNAWGGAFGSNVPYRYDNIVPKKVGAYLSLPVDTIDIVHERGNLEFNGVDTVILNWSTIGDPARNPGYTREAAEADLKQHFGVSKVVFVTGVPEGDRTKGHIDGIARFINPTTVVVPDCTANSKCRPGGRRQGRRLRRGRGDYRSRRLHGNPGPDQRCGPLPGLRVRHQLPELAGGQRVRHRRWLRGRGA